MFFFSHDVVTTHSPVAGVPVSTGIRPRTELGTVSTNASQNALWLEGDITHSLDETHYNSGVSYGRPRPRSVAEEPVRT